MLIAFYLAIDEKFSSRTVYLGYVFLGFPMKDLSFSMRTSHGLAEQNLLMKMLTTAYIRRNFKHFWNLFNISPSNTRLVLLTVLQPDRTVIEA